MAENVLGVLLVTSSPRERNVCRYPPDPTSPLARLSQPIYSKATYTAQDNTVDHSSKHRLFPRGQRSEGRPSRPQTVWSSHPSTKGHSRARPSDKSRSRMPATPRSLEANHAAYSVPSSTHSRGTDFTDGYSGSADESTDSSDDSDMDGLFDADRHHPRSSNHDKTRRLSSGTDASGRTGPGFLSSGPRPLAEIPERPRRPSAGESEGTVKHDRHKARRRDQSEIEYNYNHSLGYSLDFLADLLTPPRHECNQKFEIAVDELVFLGHPVSSLPDGTWAYPAAEDEEPLGVNHSDHDEPRRSSGGTRRGGGITDTPATKEMALRPIGEHPESPVMQRNLSVLHDVTRPSSRGGSGLDTPVGAGAETPSHRPPAGRDNDSDRLNMFHLVLILDKPDPQPDESRHSTHASFNDVYREVVFKWTAAAFALQVKDNWVSEEVKKVMRLKEKCFMEGIPINECLRKMIDASSMYRSMQELLNALHTLRVKPANSLFLNLATTLTVNVGSIPITIAVPAREGSTDHAIALRELDLDDTSSDSDTSDSWGRLEVAPDGTLMAKQPALRIEPWQTLLILDDEQSTVPAAEKAPRRGSKSRQAEEELMNALIEACDVSKPLHEIAHLLRYDLEGIVIPLARELVQTKRAILVDVVNVRLRTILMPASISDHIQTIPQHCTRWKAAFPTLPALIPFLAMISQTPVPFRDLLPPPVQADAAKREPYIRAIAWLLRNDLVLQAHVRARVVASPAVKEAAWRKQWHQRRKRWLRERLRTLSMTSNASSRSQGPASTRGSTVESGRDNSPRSDGITPRPVDISNPMDAYAARVPRASVANASLANGTSGANGTLAGPANPVAADPAARSLALDIARTLSIDPSYLSDDSDELDSDVDMDGDGADAPDNAEPIQRTFNMDETEPAHVPKFTSSFIFNPARAHKEEVRWLRIIRQRSLDAVLKSRFDLCVQYFDGIATFEEIMFRTSLSRREIDRIAHVYREDLVISVHV